LFAFPKRLRVPALAATAAGSLVAGLVYGLGPISGGASSHREAPLIAADPQVDNTDVYAFVSPDDSSKVTLISTWLPFQEPAGGPNFYAFAEGARYEILIDNDHDADEDITYRWVFTNHYRNRETFLYNTGEVTSLTDPDLNFFQTYDLLRINEDSNKRKLLVNDMRAVPSHVGVASMPDYAALRAQGIRSFGSSKVFAGQSDDPFFLDLRVFDLLYGAPDFDEAEDDTLAGFNVQTLALQVPRTELGKKGDPNAIIGVWSTASRRSARVLDDDNDRSPEWGGPFIQVSRLGMPLVNEVVIPLEDKDRWNSSEPEDDGQFLSYVTDPEVPKLIQALYGIPAPATPRNDLVAVFLTGVEGLNKPARITPSEQIRLNMSIAPGCCTFSPLGVIGGDNAGYPNGRRLADDTIDISLQVVEGELVGSPNDLGDGVDANDVPVGTTFPYVALPHAGSDASPH
jgi:Domain of unknown function (DUF4331)